MTLDLRFNGNLDPALSPLFNEISYKLRGQFNDLVSEFTVLLKDNLDWLVEGPASRNTLASPFFHYYCCLYFVHHVIKNDNYDIEQLDLHQTVAFNARFDQGILNHIGIAQAEVSCSLGIVIVFNTILILSIT